jgi:hypothetical protein
MIDTLIETPITLSQAAAELPRRRRGKRPHVSCLYRWTQSGQKDVILESIQIGGTRCTSREALQRFFERLSAPARAVQPATVGSPPVPPLRAYRSRAQRERDAAKAGQRLAEMGA